MNNTDAPTFENTILALEESSPILDRTVAVFSNLDESNSSPEMQEIDSEFYALLSVHNDEVSMNPKLFERIKYLYDNRDSVDYTTAQRLLVEKSYKGFVRNGALLDDAAKEELKKVNANLSDLYLKFNKNLLSATNAFELVVTDSAQLSGIPATCVALAAETAANSSRSGQWVFTLHAPSRLPVLTYADNRDIRETMYKGYTNSCFIGRIQ